MTVKEIIASRRKAFPSLEIVPPLKGVTKDELIASIKPFMEFEPPFINVTCHRDEYEFVKTENGQFSRKLIRRRVSETAVCASIKAAFPDIETVPHIICGGATAEHIESQLHDLKYLGINNMLALRGDSTIGEKRFTPEEGGYSHASELVSAVREFDRENETSFCVGVGAYPEKHFEAPNLESDIDNLKKKVDAGADYIITQMFFDNSFFYRFRDKCREAGISVPIIPGLKPLSTVRQLSLLPESFSIDIPEALVKEIRSDEKNAYRIGQEWCATQCRDLLSHDVPAVHFYTMGRAENVVSILKQCF